MERLLLKNIGTCWTSAGGLSGAAGEAVSNGAGRLDTVTPTWGIDASCSGAGSGPCESGRNYKSPGCEGRGGVCGAVHHVCRAAAHSLIHLACGETQVHGQTNVWPVSRGTER